MKIMFQAKVAVKVISKKFMALYGAENMTE